MCGYSVSQWVGKWMMCAGRWADRWTNGWMDGWELNDCLELAEGRETSELNSSIKVYISSLSPEVLGHITPIFTLRSKNILTLYLLGHRAVLICGLTLWVHLSGFPSMYLSWLLSPNSAPNLNSWPCLMSLHGFQISHVSFTVLISIQNTLRQVYTRNVY